jgi:hypothetical protein
MTTDRNPEPRPTRGTDESLRACQARIEALLKRVDEKRGRAR